MFNEPIKIGTTMLTEIKLVNIPNNVGYRFETFEALIDSVRSWANSSSEWILFFFLDCDDFVRGYTYANAGGKSVGYCPIGILRTMILTDSEKVITIHNHLTHWTTPSEDDIESFIELNEFLKRVKPEWAETASIIISDTEYTVMTEQKNRLMIQTKQFKEVK